MVGCYEFEDDVTDIDTFNLRPRDNHGHPIADEQRAIHFDAYEARNILKLLNGVGAFKKSAAMYQEFGKRIVEAAAAGCVGPSVDTKQAASALEQIRNDIVRRKGRPLVYRYLAILALFALVGVVTGVILFEIGNAYPTIFSANYGLVIAGSMVGAWLSVAASRHEISFAMIPDFLDLELEPAIRLLFVAIISIVTAMLVGFRVVSLSIGNLDLSMFASNPNAALLFGIFAGISERALSVDVIERAKKIFSQK